MDHSRLTITNLHLDILQSSFHLSVCYSLFWLINERGTVRRSLCNGMFPICQLSIGEFLFETPVLHHSRALSSSAWSGTNKKKQIIIQLCHPPNQCHENFNLPFRLDLHRCCCKRYSTNLAADFRAARERFQSKLHSVNKTKNYEYLIQRLWFQGTHTHVNKSLMHLINHRDQTVRSVRVDRIRQCADRLSLWPNQIKISARNEHSPTKTLQRIMY